MSLLKQPKPVYLLSFVELWNRFSHYGMRALLVLFMIKVLHYSDSLAFGIFASFTALDRLGGFFGAFIADKILGLRRAILIGGWIVAAGHLSLALGYFLFGLSLLVLGSSLFTTNINAFLGYFYENNEKRTTGYTLFYMAINIGALIATIFCGYLAETFGWEYGFGLAAIGMVIGNLALMRFGYLLEGKGTPIENPTSTMKYLLLPLLIGAGALGYGGIYIQAISFLPWIAGGLLFYLLFHLRKEKNMLVHLFAYIFFIAAEAQIHTSIMIFTDRMANHSFFGVPMTTSSILVINPLVIIFLGAFATWTYKKIGFDLLRLFVPFFLSGIAFLSISLISISGMQIPIVFLMGIVGIISFAEIFIIPITYSTCSAVSLQFDQAKIMSIIPLGYALGYSLGGGFGKFMTIIGYDMGFLLLAGILMISGLSLGIVHTKLVKKAI